MGKEIKLLKNNNNRDWDDLRWVNEFYHFLQGQIPTNISIKTGAPKLKSKIAYTIIWYLQEHFPVIPDQIKRCDVCGELYDSYSCGHYSELTGKSYCSVSCEPADLEEKELRAGLI